MNLRIWLANVGANRAHRFASPLFDGGGFELLPIPETPRRAGLHSVRFRDVRSWRDPARPLTDFFPQRLRDTAAHHDPEFETLTYGDNCERAPRATGLRGVEAGDLIFFIARLERYDGQRFTGEAGFYLVGFLEVESILKAAFARPSGHVLERFSANAHVRKALNDPVHWDGFWVFAGSARSRRLEHAVPVDRAIAQRVFLAADGRPWRWDNRRTDLQVIGSYTRTCRAIIALGQPNANARALALFEAVEHVNPGVIPPVSFW